ncbi:MAG TPA: ATPase, T2SS/T4P/T4SS family [Burkholderiaceae bacterium]|jgi:type II secretory ATPase GspE/PulE/Tfp pilus assembly ATPase PilB-like protein
MIAHFDWPIPPHFSQVMPKRSGAALDLVAPGEDEEPLPCVITMNDGHSNMGRLLDFNPENGTLDFIPKRSQATKRLLLAEVQSLRLTDKIELARVALPSMGAGSPDPDMPDEQKCSINFKFGAPLTINTMGCVSRDYGLFLYLVAARTQVLRFFIPAEAMSSFQIGEPMGQLLLKENMVAANVIEAGLEKQELLRSQKLGDYLQQQNIVSKEQIEAALARQKGLPPLRLGDALIQEDLITEEQLNEALQKQAQDRKKQLGDILIGMNAVSQESVKRVLAQKLGIPFVHLGDFEIDLNVVKIVPASLVHKHMVMPLFQSDGRIVVALENPMNFTVLQDLAFSTKLKVDPVMASAADLAKMVKQYYGTPGSGKNEDIADLMFEMSTGSDLPAQSSAPQVTESDNVLVRMVNKIILDAYEDNVSDIHIESMPGTESTRVRFRKDGRMFPYSEVPANFRNALISRIKIMSRLDISEKRHSQDGKINFREFGPAQIELRVLTIPTTGGYEDIVMRILAAPKAVSIDDIGLAPYVLNGLKKMSERPHGLIFVCGPTGSGKTTTLHAMVGYINTPDRKIWTVEDPVEITQRGLRQVQVQSKIDWTFAAILRSFMRADPDVIMVGETRDPETARIVIEASLTGHVVFSTMHTNSAVESVVRLLDLGLDPFNFADALLGVVGQRLARRLCTNCRKPYTPHDEEMQMLAHEYCVESPFAPATVLEEWHHQYGATGPITLYAAEGCKHCSNTGYKGRLGIHELLTNSPAVKKKIHAKANVTQIQEVALTEGMRTLRQDGIDKIFQGLTDWEQIRAL